MTRRTFYSFHYMPDNWRGAQVRNMGVVESNEPASDSKQAYDYIKQNLASWIDEAIRIRNSY